MYREQFEGYVLGDIGQTKQMQKILECMSCGQLKLFVFSPCWGAWISQGLLLPPLHIYLSIAPAWAGHRSALAAPLPLCSFSHLRTSPNNVSAIWGALPGYGLPAMAWAPLLILRVRLRRQAIASRLKIVFYGGITGQALESKFICTADPLALGSRSNCWWLPDMLVRDHPTSAQKSALANLYEMLRMDLERRGFPPPPYEFTPRVYLWPDLPSTMVMLYEKWWKHIHNMACRTESHISAKWWKVHSYQVTGICLSKPAWLTLPYIFRRRLPAPNEKALRAFLLAKVQSFLEPATSHKVYPADVGWQPLSPLLVVPGSKEHLPSVGIMKTRKCKKKLVLLVAVRKVCDQAALASSLQFERELSWNCYHINRLFCLCAGWSGKESPNERWIGCLKYLYRPVHGDSTTSLVQRTRARAAGLRGGIVDDEFQQLLAASHPTRPDIQLRSALEACAQLLNPNVFSLSDLSQAIWCGQHDIFQERVLGLPPMNFGRSATAENEVRLHFVPWPSPLNQMV